MYAHVMPAPAWYEHYKGETITLRPLSLAGSVQVHVGVDGMPYVLVDGQHRDTLPANLVAGDLELSIMEPVTQAVAKTKRAKNNDGVVEYDDMETVYTDLSRLPTRLTDTQKSVTADSDAVAGDDSGGLHTGGTFAPSDAQRQAAASWIVTHDTRLRNESIKFIGTNLDPVSFPAPVPSRTLRSRAYHRHTFEHVDRHGRATGVLRRVHDHRRAYHVHPQAGHDP